MSVLEGDILRIVAELAFADASLMQNVFNAVLTTEGGSTDDTDTVDDMVEWMEGMYANMSGNLHQDITTSEVVVYVYDPVDDDWDEVGRSPWTLTTNSGTHLLPRAAAALIAAESLDPDVTGRKYLGGLTEGGYENSAWVAAVLTNLGLFAADWVAQFVGTTTGGTFTPAVWSVPLGAVQAFNGVTFINSVAAYQRRRKPGVGI